MSASVLEKLKVKPMPKKIDQIMVKITDPEKEENVEIRTTIIDKTKEKLVNRKTLLKNLSEPFLQKYQKKKALKTFLLPRFHLPKKRKKSPKNFV